MKKVINPSEINELLNQRVNEQMVLNVNDGKKLINERTKDRFYGFVGSVLNNCTGWTKEGGFKKIVKTGLAIGGVALIGISNAAWIAAGASAYAIWKGHKEKKLFKKFVIANTDEYSKSEKIILNKLSLSEFYNVNINVPSEVARKFFEVRKSKQHTFDDLENIIQAKKDLVEVVKKEGSVSFVAEAEITENKKSENNKEVEIVDVVEIVKRDELYPRRKIVQPNLNADAVSNIEVIDVPLNQVSVSKSKFKMN